jgi:hypothetical protein
MFRRNKTPTNIKPNNSNHTHAYKRHDGNDARTHQCHRHS